MSDIGYHKGQNGRAFYKRIHGTPGRIPGPEASNIHTIFADIIFIKGINDRYEEAMEVFQYKTHTKFIRVFRASISENSKYNRVIDYDIPLTDAEGNLITTIKKGFNCSEELAYTIPPGWNAYITDISITGDGEFALYKREDIADLIEPFKAPKLISRFRDSTHYNFKAWVYLDELTDVWISGEQDAIASIVLFMEKKC